MLSSRLLSLMFVIVAGSGCGGHAKTSAKPAAALGDPMNESIGGIATGASSTVAEKLFGAPEKKGEAQEMAATGEVLATWEWPSKGLRLEMASGQGGALSVSAISIAAPSKLTTSRGVGIGTTRAEVERIYQEFLGQGRQDGEPDTTTPEHLIVGSLYGGTSFIFADGKVTVISVGAGAE